METINDEEFKQMRVQATAHGMARVFENMLEKEAGAGEEVAKLIKTVFTSAPGMAVNAGLIGGGALGVGASILGQQRKSMNEEERRARRRIAYYQQLTNRIAERAGGAA